MENIKSSVIIAILGNYREHRAISHILLVLQNAAHLSVPLVRVYIHINALNVFIRRNFEVVKMNIYVK